MSATPKAMFRFVITNEDRNASRAQVLDRLQTATSKAIESARSEYDMQATTQVDGGMGGLGETAVVLAIWHIAKAGAAAFAAGVAGAAGKKFFDDYLAKELRKLNLLPSKVQESPATLAPEAVASQEEAGTTKKTTESSN